MKKNMYSTLFILTLLCIGCTKSSAPVEAATDCTTDNSCATTATSGENSAVQPFTLDTSYLIRSTHTGGTSQDNDEVSLSYLYLYDDSSRVVTQYAFASIGTSAPLDVEDSAVRAHTFREVDHFTYESDSTNPIHFQQFWDCLQEGQNSFIVYEYDSVGNIVSMKRDTYHANGDLLSSDTVPENGNNYIIAHPDNLPTAAGLQEWVDKNSAEAKDCTYTDTIDSWTLTCANGTQIIRAYSPEAITYMQNNDGPYCAGQ